MTPLRHTLTSRDRTKRVRLKRFMYAQLALRSAVMIARGREQPLVTFTVEEDPPSVYLVFELRAEVVDGVIDRLGLPPGMAPAAVRCLADDEPRYLLVLNVYRVSGITNGRRAEWSTFVAEPDGTPRYMVIDARSSSRSMDPVDLFTKASRVDHERQGDQIAMTIGGKGAVFRATIDLDGATPAVNAPEWVTANDRIYWGNGVCDRTFYDAGLAAPALLAVPPANTEIDDASPWAELVEPDPVAVLMFTEAIEFVVSPGENVDALEA
jgi:hypothetical protein